MIITYFSVILQVVFVRKNNNVVILQVVFEGTSKNKGKMRGKRANLDNTWLSTNLLL